MTDDDDQLETLLHDWAREQVRTAPQITPPTVVTLLRPSRRSRVWSVSVAAIVAVGIVTVGGVLLADNGSPAERALPGVTRSVVSPSSSPRSSGLDGASPRPDVTQSHPIVTQSHPVVAPSPPPPPFGTCGGLNSVADARYIVSGDEAVAVVAASISGPGTGLSYGGGVERAVPVSDVRVLAGRLPGGGLTTIDYSPLRHGRYLLVLGGAYGEYYPAFGQYGVYAIAGSHAYRTCYPFGLPLHTVRGGITTIRGLTTIFGRALS